MNKYKIRSILDFFRSQPRLPTNQRGEILSPDDILAWYGADMLLTVEEQSHVKHELLLISEAQAFIERIRLAQQ